MKCFRRVKKGVDVEPFLSEIASIARAWDRNTGRQDKIAVQREAEAIALRGLVKSKIAGEDARMREGELWWFDNKQEHEAFNDGEADRIHFIFDLLPRARAAEVFGTERAA